MCVGVNIDYQLYAYCVLHSHPISVILEYLRQACDVICQVCHCNYSGCPYNPYPLNTRPPIERSINPDTCSARERIFDFKRLFSFCPAFKGCPL